MKRYVFCFVVAILVFAFGASLPSFSAENSVRYDGVYVSERQTSGKADYWEYLRFFPDNTVASVASTGRPEEVLKWLSKDHKGVMSREVFIRNGTMSFSKEMSWDCVGEFSDDHLYLQRFNRDTQRCEEHDYVFVPAALAANFKMPDAAPASGIGDGTKRHSRAGSLNAIDMSSDFLGTFEDKIPKVIGGTIPEQNFSVNCDANAGCLVRFGEGRGDLFDKVAPAQSLKYAKEALAYAKSHRDVGSSSPMYWPAKNLRPLLDSSAEIDSCVDLSGDAVKGMPVLPAGSPAFFQLCKLTDNPWDRPVVVFMGMRQGRCGDLFCGYEIYPAFRRTGAADAR